MANFNNDSTNLNIGYYEKRYDTADLPFVDIEILDVIKGIEQQNIGCLTHIQMELYPVCDNYFYINGKKLRSFDGSYTSPPDLDIYSLKIQPKVGTTISIVYYYYL